MSFGLFCRCIVCSRRSSSCLPLTIKLHSPSFTFSPLSSMSASHTSSLNVISDFLTKECGFSSSQMTTIMTIQPNLLRSKSDQNVREVIQLLKELGLTENKLKGTILRSPTILGRRANRQLKPKMEFLKKIGLTTQDIGHIVFRTPRLLEMSLENCLAPRIIHLETLFGSKDHLCKVLRRVSSLLATDFEKQVKPKVEYLKNIIGIPEDSAAFVGAIDVVARLSFENLEKKIEHMVSLGLAEEEICQIIKSHPEVLSKSTKKIKENIDFLMRIGGLELKIVTSYPAILNYSVEKRLKPRYEVFKSLRTSSHAEGLPCLAQFFGLSEQKFLKKFGQYYIKSSPTIIQSPKASILEQ